MKYLLRLLYELWYVIRLAAYLLRLPLWTLHAGMVFFTKPGSRMIVPVCLSALALFGHEAVHAFVLPYIAQASDYSGYDLTFDWKWTPSVYVEIIIWVFAWAYSRVSRFLKPILGALPSPTRPFWPARSLRAPTIHVKHRKLRVVIKRPLRIPMPRRSHADTIRALPPEVAGLLLKTKIRCAESSQ